jgi:hypothetical protein
LWPELLSDALRIALLQDQVKELGRHVGAARMVSKLYEGIARDALEGDLVKAKKRRK